MKRTTYIITGMLLAGLAFTIAATIYATSGSGERLPRTAELGGQTRTLTLPACKAVALTYEHKGERSDVFELSLEIAEAHQATGSLTLGSEVAELLTTTLTTDSVLQLHFVLQSDSMEATRGQRMMWLHATPLRMALPEGVQSIRTELPLMVTRINGLRRDTLAIEAADRVHIRDCEFKALRLEGMNAYFHMESGKADNLHVNLDNTNYWTTATDSFRIGTEWLTGSHSHECNWVKSESREVHWMPKTEEARLTLTLEQGARIRPLNEE